MLEYVDIAIGFATVMLLLSLIVTVIVQAVSTLLDLRGNNLVWALAKLFQQMPIAGMNDKVRAPATGKEKNYTVAKELARAVARDSSITPSKYLGFLFKAKAIRADELQNIVHKLAEAPPAKASVEAKKALKQLVQEHVPGAGESVERAKALSTELERLMPARAQAVRDAVEQVMGKTERVAAELDKWFDSIMDRSTDRFARNSRLWSAAIAAVLAIGLQIDAVSIFKQISDDAGVRTQLVAMAGPALQQAQQIEDSAKVAGKTLAEMKKEDAYKAQLQDAPESLGTCSAGEAWIRDKVAQPDQLVQEFDKRCQPRQTQAFGASAEQIKTLKATVDTTKLKIYHDWKWANFKFWNLGWTVLLGCASTVVLLSLGAPFWFNALRQMSTLRPPTSQKITREEKAGAEAETQKAAATAAGAKK